jgi:hypothetical protein
LCLNLENSCAETLFEVFNVENIIDNSLDNGSFVALLNGNDDDDDKEDRLLWELAVIQ